jgi:hypothetical protein
MSSIRTKDNEKNQLRHQDFSKVSREKVIALAIDCLKKFSLHSADAFWSAAFVRHKGYFTYKEQDTLRYSTVSIAGLGELKAMFF